mmetsp:Transcript_115264/g.264689  ORF Transcript_115264/g.264689 Transcript_115264/m.264689 type:complete len:265 (+) Transcript_115264:1678-2472(+)
MWILLRAQPHSPVAWTPPYPFPRGTPAPWRPVCGEGRPGRQRGVIALRGGLAGAGSWSPGVAARAWHPALPKNGCEPHGALPMRLGGSCSTPATSLQFQWRGPGASSPPACEDGHEAPPRGGSAAKQSDPQLSARAAVVASAHGLRGAGRGRSPTYFGAELWSPSIPVHAAVSDSPCAPRATWSATQIALELHAGARQHGSAAACGASESPQRDHFSAETLELVHVLLLGPPDATCKRSRAAKRKKSFPQPASWPAIPHSHGHL